MVFETRQADGFWGWWASEGQVNVHFGGKGPHLEREVAARRILPQGIEPAWLNQVHSATVLNARPGNNGQGDALFTDRQDLALTVVTADCVPVLLASDCGLVAAHAGWRGLAHSILPAALENLRAVASCSITAWIGPTIGPCCYEVGADVAQAVCAASSSRVAQDGPRGRPHLNLALAARIQLERSDSVQVHTVGACTRCDEARLWSYRREGPGAGRNIAAIWRERH